MTVNYRKIVQKKNTIQSNSKLAIYLHDVI